MLFFFFVLISTSLTANVPYRLRPSAQAQNGRMSHAEINQKDSFKFARAVEEEDPPVSNAPEMSYGGGQVMTNPVKLYVIYFGDWTTSQIEDVDYFLNNIGASDWYGINRKYFKPVFGNDDKYISSNVSIAKRIQVPGTAKDLSRNYADTKDYRPVFEKYLDEKVFDEDPDAIYMLLTSFLHADDCGMHNYFDRNNKNLKWIYIGLDPENSSCGISWVPSINGKLDGLFSTIAHDLAETTR